MTLLGTLDLNEVRSARLGSRSQAVVLVSMHQQHPELEVLWRDVSTLAPKERANRAVSWGLPEAQADGLPGESAPGLTLYDPQGCVRWSAQGYQGASVVDQQIRALLAEQSD